jgi:hypothetical protein
MMVSDLNIRSRVVPPLAVAILCLLQAYTVAAQKTEYLQLALGGGSYYMKGLKDFEQASTGGSTIAIENVENFTPYWSYYLKGGKQVKRNEFGTVLSLCSTGSRSAYEDYSGFIYFDQIVYGVNLGAFINFLLHENEHGSFYFAIGSNIVSSFYEIKESTRIYSEKSSQKLEAWSVGFDINFSFSYRYQLNRFFIQPDAGLNLNFYNTTLRAYEGKNKLHFSYQNEEKPLKVNWSGVRAYIGVGYYLTKK